MPRVSAVILVDGSEEKLLVDEASQLHHLHVPYDGNFNLSFMRNIGVRKAADLGFEFVQIMDSDIFPENTAYIEACLSAMSKVDMVKPYVVNSPVAVTDVEYDKFTKPNLAKCKRKVFSYSTMFMRISAPKKIHGWDEAYQIWGAEDDDFLVRASRTGFRSGNMKSPLLVHSHHLSDTCNKAKKETDQYDKNFARFKKTRAGLLPNIRMPDDWGLHLKPRTSVMLRFKK